MVELRLFKFTSEYVLDDNKEKIEFNVKGYKKTENDTIIFYFKNDNSYKFVIYDNFLEVYVDESFYKFDTNKKTEALIRSGNYSYNASIITEKLEISLNRIEIKYILDFNSFKGYYTITLELL